MSYLNLFSIRFCESQFRSLLFFHIYLFCLHAHVCALACMCSCMNICTRQHSCWAQRTLLWPSSLLMWIPKAVSLDSKCFWPRNHLTSLSGSLLNEWEWCSVINLCDGMTWNAAYKGNNNPRWWLCVLKLFSFQAHGVFSRYQAFYLHGCLAFVSQRRCSHAEQCSPKHGDGTEASITTIWIKFTNDSSTVSL